MLNSDGREIPLINQERIEIMREILGEQGDHSRIASYVGKELVTYVDHLTDIIKSLVKSGEAAVEWLSEDFPCKELEELDKAITKARKAL